MSNQNQHDKTKRVLLKNQQISSNDIEANIKFQERMGKRKKRIEILFEQSVANQIYIFPKNKYQIHDEDETESEDIETNQQGSYYDLKNQNKKNKNYQTSSQMYMRCSSLTEVQAERLQNSKRKQQLLQSQRHKKEAKDQSFGISNFHSKPKKAKDKKQDKTALNSSKKLIVAEQYSLNNNHVNTKKASHTITISCKTKKIEPPKHRLRTQFS